MQNKQLNNFNCVDQSANPYSLVSYLDLVNEQPFIKQLRNLTFRLVSNKKGNTYLDVGCGLGSNTAQLAIKLGNAAKVVGIDKSQIFVTEARKRHKTIENADFQIADIQNPILLPTNTFDGCYAMRVMQHLHEPQDSVCQMIRALKRNGRLVICDPDWSTLVINGSDKSLSQRVSSYICNKITNGAIAHYTPSILKQAGLKKVKVIPKTWMINNYHTFEQIILRSNLTAAVENKALTLHETQVFSGDLFDKQQKNEFFSAITFFTVYGQK